jgi:MFS transporter, UMF1 family
MPATDRRAVWSWALYDWANSAFATTVMAGFFPVFFKEYWSKGIDAGESTYALGVANSAAAAVVAVAAPLLGALADQGMGKKIFLGVFTLLGALATALLFRVGAGAWAEAATLYALASAGFAAAIVFYDALITDVSPAGQLDMVSSLGYALGYLGGGLLFAANVAMYLKPDLFGLESGVAGIQWSFVSVGAWWILFSLPLFIFVKDSSRPAQRPPWLKIMTMGWRSFVATLWRISRYKPLLLFLAAYFFYIDGVNTIIKMAVDYGMAIGLEPKHLIGALLLVQFVGFPAAVAFGYLAEKWGARMGVFICLWVYGAITVLAFLMRESWHFYALAAAIGLVQGGVQALSRSIFARMIPPEESGEYFGFFNLLGKFSAVLGPVAMGVISYWTGEPRWSILVLLAMFLGGGLLLRRVDPKYKVPVA